MKSYKIHFIFIIFFICNLCFSQPDYSVIFDNYYSLRNNFFPNDENSENEKKLIKYLEFVCKTYNLKYSITKIEDDKNVTNSFNFEISIESNIKTDENIIFISPLNSIILYQDYYDNSLGLKTMLDLIKKCKERNLKKNISFVFSGANSRENNYEFYGLKKLLESKKNMSKSIIIVLDILSSQEKIKFSGSINRKQIPLLFFEYFLKLNDKKFYFDSLDIIKAKFSLIKIEDYATYLLNKDISVISFSNREKTYSTSFYFNEDYEKKLTEYFFKWVEYLDKKNYPIDADYNYQIFAIFNFKIIMPEIVQIIIFLVVIFLIILLRHFLPNFQRLDFNLILKIYPYFIVLFFIFFVLSFIPYLLFLIAKFLFKIEISFINIPILYFFNVFFIPLMLIFIIFEILNKLPFPKHNYLYIFGAVVTTFTNLLLFILIDISLAYIYLWVVLIITVSNFTGRNFILKIMLYFFSMFPVIWFFINLTLLGNIPIIRSSLETPIIQHLTFCFIMFPFLLLFIRVRIILKSKFKIYFNKFIIFGITIITLLISVAFFIFIALKVFPEEQIIYAKLVSGLNNNNYLLLKSNTKIGKITIREGNFYNVTTLEKTNFGRIKIKNVKKNYSINLEKKTQVEYSNYNLKINSIYDIEYLRIFLIVPYSFYPLESNYNYTKIEKFEFDYDPVKEEVYSFLIPRNIGKEIDFNLSLIPNIKYKMYLQIDYPSIDQTDVDIKKENGFIYKNTEFVEVLDL